MDNLFEFFAKDKVMVWSAVIAAVLMIAAGVIKTAAFGELFWLLMALFLMVVLYCTLVSYRKHEKNVMKGMLGALLTFSAISQFYTLDKGVALSSEIATSSLGIFRFLLDIVFAILLLWVLANHFVINSDHHSNPKKVHRNQMCVLITAIVALFLCFIALAMGQNDDYAHCLVYVSYVFICAVVVCVESKLDVFRVRREDAGWKEKK